MLLSIKKKIKENLVVETIFRWLCVPLFLMGKIGFDLGVLLRKMGLVGKYSQLRRYKGKYINQRCFIIATGPSLTIADLELLQNEYTFGMNSVALAYDQTAWRPTFYGIQDEYVYEKMEPELEKHFIPDFFLSNSIVKYHTVPKHTVQFPLDYMNHKMPNAKYNTKFSQDCSLRVYDGYTIAYSLIQLATYMGFTTIYLLGADCNYSGPVKRFRDHGAEDKTLDNAYERYVCAYKVAKQYAEKNGIQIINVTRGGNLEVFPRQTLESVLGLNKA